MTLIAGSTLQNGKYRIDAILHQSDFSVTYRGMHQYLDHPVIIQTFNDSLRHHSRYDQLCQTFAAEVRRRMTHQITSPITLLDGFEEDQQPFMVTLYGVDQPIPRLRDWLPLTRLITASEAAINLDPALPAIAEMPAPELNSVILDGDVEAIAPLPSNNGSTNGLGNGSVAAIAPDGRTVEYSDRDAAHTLPPADPIGAGPSWTQPPADGLADSAPVPTLVASPHPSGAVGMANPSNGRSPQVPRRSSPVLPMALLLTAVVGGVAGATVGWGLRFGSPDLNPASQGDNSAPFNLGNKDQSFPAQQSWPISETSIDSAPEPESSWPVQEYQERQQPIRYQPDPDPATFDSRSFEEPEPEPFSDLALPEKDEPAGNQDAAPVAEPPAKAPPAAPAEPINPPPPLPDSLSVPPDPNLSLPPAPAPAAPDTNSLSVDPPGDPSKVE